MAKKSETRAASRANPETAAQKPLQKQRAVDYGGDIPAILKAMLQRLDDILDRMGGANG